MATDPSILMHLNTYSMKFVKKKAYQWVHEQHCVIL